MATDWGKPKIKIIESPDLTEDGQTMVQVDMEWGDRKYVGRMILPEASLMPLVDSIKEYVSQ